MLGARQGPDTGTQLGDRAESWSINQTLGSLRLEEAEGGWNEGRGSGRGVQPVCGATPGEGGAWVGQSSLHWCGGTSGASRDRYFHGAGSFGKYYLVRAPCVPSTMVVQPGREEPAAEHQPCYRRSEKGWKTLGCPGLGHNGTSPCKGRRTGQLPWDPTGERWRGHRGVQEDLRSNLDGRPFLREERERWSPDKACTWPGSRARPLWTGTVAALGRESWLRRSASWHHSPKVDQEGATWPCLAGAPE